jgi:hypothetical protein
MPRGLIPGKNPSLSMAELYKGQNKTNLIQPHDADDGGAPTVMKL